MAFPNTSAQQAETNSKSLEEIHTRKQLLAGGIMNLGLSNTNQMPAPQLLGQPSTTTATPDLVSTNSTPPRAAFNPSSSTTLGFFIPQDSYFGNSLIPVLPRLELPATPSTTTPPITPIANANNPK
ncbi:uncharacterized protein Dwil_GK21300 [Drosophila willistoni]|uniref:SOSS complex subunit C homolog A n=1 Tax=Drosophila willistoni TaxID=7260 RepID=SOSCA_DROWI|nr:RecName: Full=SOSS complex subunit C homolog A [Drosophila willistoni]EDW71650.1 uncharacterized protein Dwil_GK21300 [Drosophila willistoni]